jgi:hypothetical protein
MEDGVLAPQPDEIAVQRIDERVGVPFGEVELAPLTTTDRSPLGTA